jgi:hypothetical protein
LEPPSEGEGGGAVIVQAARCTLFMFEGYESADALEERKEGMKTRKEGRNKEREQIK